MGRTTFEPALGIDRWPWPNLEVFVLASQRPQGTPDHVVVDGDPARLLELMRAANKGGDVHLVGGPRTMRRFERSAYWTSSSWWCSRFCSATGCG